MIGVSRLAAPLLLAAALLAPFQCARKPPPEQRTEDDAAEVLYTLAEKFKTEGNPSARTTTLRYLVQRYPTSRFAATAESDLDELGGKR